MARVSLDMSRTSGQARFTLSRQAQSVPAAGGTTLERQKSRFMRSSPSRRHTPSFVLGPPEAPTPTPFQGDRGQSGGGGRLGLISIGFQLIVYGHLLLYMVVKLSRSSLPLADS